MQRREKKKTDKDIKKEERGRQRTSLVQGLRSSASSSLVLREGRLGCGVDIV